jgi:hypothetical protein
MRIDACTHANVIEPSRAKRSLGAGVDPHR